MESSNEVLARKYRPKNFDELIGQESVSQTLSLALDTNRLSHAYLFSGLRGSGKTSTARIFAKALLCDKGISHNPCGECENCIMAMENRHIDIIEMDGASSRKIDDIRELIEQTKYKPTVARFKIFIIDEVHMLTREAFNALLKTLEEPPSYVKFILATTDPLKLPATILSRTQHFRFKKIATSKITAHLKYILELEGIGYDIEALEILARSGEGSLRDTLTLLDQAIIYSKGHVDVLTVTDMLGLVDPKFINDLFDAVFKKDKKKIIEYCKFLEDYEAEMVINELIVYLKERLLDGDGMFSPLVIERFFRILSQSKYLLNINADGGFVLNLVFFKMIEALKIQDIDEMIKKYEAECEIDINDKDLPTQNPQPIKQNPQPQIKETIEKIDKGVQLYNNLLEKIKDRSYELGECFEKYITYVSFENGILSWESCANITCKDKLKHGYSVIKMLVQDTFGFGTKIKGIPCSKEIKEETQPKIEQPSQQIAEEKNKEALKEDIKKEENEVIGASSCVASCAGLDEAKSEVDDIMQEEVVQKAVELFEAKKVIIQSKV